MKVVLDTNILFVILSNKSNYRKIFDAFLDEKYTLCFTNEILEEYREIISNKMSPHIFESFLNLLFEQPNIQLITKYFSWNLISTDFDDNKFVDCAIACNATFLVSEDKHFKVLKQITFPKVNITDIDQFILEIDKKV
jgi:uncharacterized protein